MKKIGILFALVALIAGCTTVPNQPIDAKVSMIDSGAQNGKIKIQTIEFRAGVSSFSVERIAKEYGCNGGKGAGLITDQGPVEVYRMRCDSGRNFLARCEQRQCIAMR